MSLIYTTAFAGSIIAGLANVWITDRIGFGLACPLGALAHVISYMMCGTGGPYAVFLIGYAFNGFGLSLQDAQVNNITSRLPSAGTKMAFVQACFGLGGTLAPFLSTAFAANVREAWYYYFVAMGVALLALVIMLLAFDMRTEEQLIQPEDWKEGERLETAQDRERAAQAEREREMREKGGEVESEPEPEPKAPKKPATSGQKMKRIFATPAVWALMGFSFLYIGVEVAISSWMVSWSVTKSSQQTSFLIEKRGGNANAGYAVTGFWGGMTVGRVVLLPVTNFLGYQPSIYL
jgi:fucose permease